MRILEYIVDLGSDTGDVIFEWEGNDLPDRFLVDWDGSNVIDAGYYGASSYDFGGINRGAFNAVLNGLTDPITGNPYPDTGTYPDDGYPRVTNPSSGMDSFNKSTASPTNATVTVYSPFTNSTGRFVLLCPGITTTTTTTSTTTVAPVYTYRVSNITYPTEIDTCAASGSFPLTTIVYSNKLPGSLMNEYLYEDVGLSIVHYMSDGFHLFYGASPTMYIIKSTSNLITYENACP